MFPLKLLEERTSPSSAALLDLSETFGLLLQAGLQTNYLSNKKSGAPKIDLLKVFAEVQTFIMQINQNWSQLLGIKTSESNDETYEAD